MAVELDYFEYADDPASQAAYVTNGHHAVTFNNTAQLDTTDKKWGSASLQLDGDSDYLSLADHADWDIINTTNWTMDFFVKHTDHALNEIYASQREDLQNRWILQHQHGNGLYFDFISGGASIVKLDAQAVGEITDTNWHHIALIKVGTEYGIYLDGTQVSYVNDASTDTLVGPLHIGASGGPSDFFDGHIDEFRIIHSNVFSANPADAFGNGEAPDTITPPAAPHQTDTDTKLLLHLDGADEAVATVDWSRLESRSDDTIEQQGTYCLEGFANTDALNDTLTRTIGAPIDLTGQTDISLKIRASRTGSHIKIGIHDAGGVTTEHTANIASANTWQTENWDISAVADGDKDAIDSIIITVTNADADNLFYIDDFFSEIYVSKERNIVYDLIAYIVKERNIVYDLFVWVAKTRDIVYNLVGPPSFAYCLKFYNTSDAKVAEISGDMKNPTVSDLNFELLQQGGCGAFHFTLAEPYTTATIDYNYKVEMYFFHPQTLYYTGKILQKPVEGTEKPQTYAGWGYFNELEKKIINTEISPGSDIAVEVTSLLDTYIISYSSITKDANLIETVSHTLVSTIDINDEYAKWAFDRLKELAVDYKYGVDRHNNFYFQAIDTSINEYWHVGKHLSEFLPEEDATGIVNKVIAVCDPQLFSDGYELKATAQSAGYADINDKRYSIPQIINPFSGTDLASGITPTTSPVAGTPANMTDGNNATLWESGANQANTDYIEIDFTTNQSNISKVVIDSIHANAQAFNAKSIKVEIKPDGGSYSTILTSDSDIGWKPTITFRPTTGRYIKLSLTQSSSEHWKVGEVEVYALDMTDIQRWADWKLTTVENIKKRATARINGLDKYILTRNTLGPIRPIGKARIFDRTGTAIDDYQMKACRYGLSSSGFSLDLELGEEARTMADDMKDLERRIRETENSGVRRAKNLSVSKGFQLSGIGDTYIDSDSIETKHLAALAVIAAKLNITDLADIVNLLTVDSGKIVIGANALGAGKTGIVINDGTRDRVKIGEIGADYRVECYTSAGVAIVDGQNKMLRWHASGEIDLDDPGTVYYNHGFNYWPTYMCHGIADAWYGSLWDYVDRSFIKAQLDGGANDRINFTNEAGQDLYVLYICYKEGTASQFFFPRPQNLVPKSSMKINNHQTVFIYDKTTKMIKQSIMSGGGKIDFFTDIGPNRDYYIYDHGQVWGIGYLRLKFNSGIPTRFEKKPVIKFEVSGGAIPKIKVKTDKEIKSNIKIAIADDKTKKHLRIVKEDHIEKLKDVQLTGLSSGKYRIYTPITNDYISEPVDIEV